MSQVTVESLSHDGRGVARQKGKTVFVANAIPGDSVEIRVTQQHQNFDEAVVIDLVSASSERVEPFCPVFSECGGCQLQYASIDAQRKWKQEHFIRSLMKAVDGSKCTIAVPLISEDKAYRRRARFVYGRNQGEALPKMGFRSDHSNRIVDITNCPILTSEINTSLKQKREQLLPIASRAHKEVVTVESDGQACWSDEKKQCHYDLYQLSFFFPSDGFIQANSVINQKMVSQAIDWLDLETSHQVLDLFCGVGNFSLPIARQVKSVVGVEGDSELIEFAQQNAGNNGLQNCAFHKADLFKDITSLHWFRKQKYDRVLLDPGRMGAFELTKMLGQLQAKIIVYVSCNASTMIRDLKQLQEQGYQLRKTGFIDMFPHTTHAEVMVQMVKTKQQKKIPKRTAFKL